MRTGSRLRWHVLDRLARRESVSCYLRIDTPLKFTPVVPSDEIQQLERDYRLDVVHEAHSWSETDDWTRILHVDDYRIYVPWPPDPKRYAETAAEDETGSIRDHKEYDIRVEKTE